MKRRTRFAAALAALALWPASALAHGTLEAPRHESLAAILEGGSLAAFGLALAFVLGAVHALSPGHGKALVAAYLVGRRGTSRHAVALGLVVTVTHVASVVVLGLLALWASETLVPEALAPWLMAASGLMILAIGASRVRSLLAARRRAVGARHDDHGHDHHDHDHDHDHGHHHHGHRHHGHHHHGPGDRAPGLWSLLVMGVSGGLVPCPSALVVLLLAVSLGRIVDGLLLVAAFSVGLAAVLVATGLLVVHARRLVDRLLPGRRVLSLLPSVSAAAVTLIGAAVVARGLAGIVP